MSNWKRLLRDGTLTIAVMAAVFLLVLVLQQFFKADKLIPMLFVLGVFIVSLKTERYLWGVMASLIGVLLVNYAFMFPYYAIDLLTPVNMATAIVMLIVSVMTSTLTTQISIQQEMKAAAERERMRANLLRAISHDLRTPLTSISGACSVMLDNHDSLPEEQQLTLLGDMRWDADWLIRMVENLLSVTRIDNGNVQIKKTPIVLEEFIDSVVLKFRKHFPEQKVQIQIPEEFVIIPMDSMLLQQVLINLLENAVYHAKGMTELIIAVECRENKAAFFVRDNGCGIPAERLKNLFSEYLHREMQQPTDGTRHNMGIGLSVCSAIIKAHGSEIIARNRPEGGAEFTFALEMEDPDE